MSHIASDIRNIYMVHRIRVCENCKAFFKNDSDADEHHYYTGHSTNAYFEYGEYNKPSYPKELEE